MAMQSTLSPQVRQQRIRRVTVVGMVVNLLLSVGKIVAGVLGRSAAMISDGVHSISDFVSDIVVLVCVRFSGRKRDDRLSFGYGKFETLATLVIVLLLITVGAKLFASGIEGILAVLRGEQLESPRAIALWAAIVSIVSKEILYRYTAVVGRQVDSPVVVANAWHHRSDALSSIGSLFGIGGAMLLGGSWIVLDPLVSCGISIFLIVNAVRMSVPAIRELLNFSVPREMLAEMKRIAESVPGVVDLHNLKTFSNGPSIVIEAHLAVKSDISVAEAHDISTNVERALIDRFGLETQVSIHIEPEHSCRHDDEQ